MKKVMNKFKLQQKFRDFMFLYETFFLNIYCGLTKYILTKTLFKRLFIKF